MMIEHLWLLCAGLSVLVMLLGIVLTVLTGHFQPVQPTGLARGFKRRVLAMELARCPHEVDLILGRFNQRNRTVMRQIQVVDYLFILAYWMLFAAAAIALVHRNFILGIASLLCATIAALSDDFENAYILKILRIPLDAKAQTRITRCRFFGTVKWAALFLYMILISALFCSLAKEHGWGLYLMAGALTLTGITGSVTLWLDGKVEYAVNAIGPLLVALAVSFGYCAAKNISLF